MECKGCNREPTACTSHVTQLWWLCGDLGRVMGVSPASSQHRTGSASLALPPPPPVHGSRAGPNAGYYL